MDNQTAVSLKITNSITGEKKLERYASQLKVIKSALSGMDTGMIKSIEDSSGTINQMDKNIKDIGTRSKVAFNYGLVNKFTRSMKTLVTTLSKVTTQSSAFLEDFNLFQVAFEGNYKSALKFVNTMSEMYGLDEGWLMRTTGIFKQLSNAMGVSVETGEKLSELLTRMSVDISSLYNVDVEKASQVLQSAMAGQTKPVRGTTGGDITQATLQTTLGKLGIDEYVGNLSFAEKRLLIIISLTDQLSAATGDWSRTLESPANQLRILDEQWTRLTRSVGNLFINTLGKVLPYLNAILMVLTEIIGTVATLFGFDLSNYDYFGDTVGNAWDLDDALSSAGSSAKKLKQGLRGFDKLNVITTPSSGASGGGSAGGMGNIDPKLLDAFNKAYDSYLAKLEETKMKATQIRDNIMDWLGFTKVIDPITGEISWKYNGISTTLKNMWDSFKGLSPWAKLLVGFVGYLFGASVFNGAKKIFNLIKNTKLTKKVSGLLSPLRKLGGMLKDDIAGGFTGLGKSMKESINMWSATLTGVDKLKVGLIGTGGLLFSFDLIRDAMEKVGETGEVTAGTIAQTMTGIVGNVASGALLLGSHFGTTGAIIGGLGGLFLGLYETFSRYPSETERVVNETNNVLASYEETIARLENQASASMELLESKTSRAKGIIQELGNGMVDSNGKVTGSYQEVQAKLNAVNDLLGTNYSISEGVVTINGKKVKSYQDLTRGVNKYCEQLRAEAMLEAYRESYLEKLKQQKTLENQRKEVLEQINGTLDEAQKKQGYTYDKWKRDNKDLLTKFTEIDQAVRKNQEEVTNYEKASYEVSKGNFKTATDLISKEGTATKRTWQDVARDMESQMGNVTKTVEESLNKLKMKEFTCDVKLKPDTSAIDGAIKKYAGAKIELSSPYDKKKSTIGTISIKTYANGGLPPVGQLFVANENGPELVGQIGGKSFVANQNQMMNLLDKKIGNASGGMNNATFIIQVGSKEVARTVLTDLQDMAKSNGKTITIG